VRFYFTNTANTRLFNVALPGARGRDGSRFASSHCGTELKRCERRVLVRYLLSAVFALLAYAVTVVLLVVCLAVVVATRWRALVKAV
jgi:hypothetical protein